MPILVLDFDGVCNDYRSGWQGIDVCNDPPVEGLEAFLLAALRHFEVHIHSSRSQVELGRLTMQRWFRQWIAPHVVGCLFFPEHKPPAFLTLDDRAIQFTGTWPDVQALLAFQPWTRTTPLHGERPPEDTP